MLSPDTPSHPGAWTAPETPPPHLRQALEPEQGECGRQAACPGRGDPFPVHTGELRVWPYEAAPGPGGPDPWVVRADADSHEMQIANPG